MSRAEKSAGVDMGLGRQKGLEKSRLPAVSEVIPLPPGQSEWGALHQKRVKQADRVTERKVGGCWQGPAR